MDKLTIIDWTNSSLPEIVKVSSEIKTLEQVFELNPPSIGLINKIYGLSKTTDIISLQILAVLDFFNVKGSMSNDQVKMTAELILEAYYWLTIPDINICFKKAKLGEYGKLYSSIDGQVILLWFKKYANDRAEQAAIASYNMHQERKKGGSTIDPELAAKLKEFAKEIVSKKEDEKKRRQTEISELEADIIQAFDKLHKEQKYPLLQGTSIRIAKYEGINYTFEDFAKMIYKQLNEQK